jgi:hypothetical protein
MSNSKFDLNRKKPSRFKKSDRYYDDYRADDGEISAKDIRNDKQKKKMKKITSALRTKDIDKLIEFEEDFD